MRVPRLNGCSCDGQGALAKTDKIDGLVNWVSPELEFIQSKLAAIIPYARTAGLLDLLLPVDAGNAPSTVRSMSGNTWIQNCTRQPIRCTLNVQRQTQIR
jgi:hypothetical protein